MLYTQEFHFLWWVGQGKTLNFHDLDVLTSYKQPPNNLTSQFTAFQRAISEYPSSTLLPSHRLIFDV